MTLNRLKIYSCLATACLCCAATTSHAEETSIHVRAGDITAASIGERASASISIGAMAESPRQGCAKVDVETGTIRKIAVGKGASASISLPGQQSNCQEKRP